MNWHIKLRKKAMAIWFLATLVMALPATAAPPAKPSPAPEQPWVAVRSVFIVPTNSLQGRDPFFPNSTRLYEVVSAAHPQVGDLSSLVLKGISGPANGRLAIINNHTFGAGDEANLVTPQGPIHIHCIEVKASSVVIESGGQRHELKYATNP